MSAVCLHSKFSSVGSLHKKYFLEFLNPKYSKIFFMVFEAISSRARHLNSFFQDLLTKVDVINTIKLTFESKSDRKRYNVGFTKPWYLWNLMNLWKDIILDSQNLGIYFCKNYWVTWLTLGGWILSSLFFNYFLWIRTFYTLLYTQSNPWNDFFHLFLMSQFFWSTFSTVAQ